MSHAEQCPVCKGTGRVFRFPETTSTNTVICNGCGGTGWITVDD